MGRIGAVRSRACSRDFSSTQSTIALSGGARYSPMTSVTLATSSGSVENLKVSERHGWTPYSRQHRATVALPTPSLAASSLLDQWVTPSDLGGGLRVAAMIRSCLTCRGRPDRASSCSPSMPCSANRSRHRSTVGRDMPTSSAIRVFAVPSPASRTILARFASPALTLDARVSRVSASRSASVRARAAAGAAGMEHCPATGSIN